MDTDAARRGQAFVETALLLLAFALAMGLLILAANVAVEGLRLQSETRAEAGKGALNVTAGLQGRGINEWQPGKDGIDFTPDDTAVTGHGYILAPFADNAYSVKEDELEVDVPPVAQDYFLPSETLRLRSRAAIPAMGL